LAASSSCQAPMGRADLGADRKIQDDGATPRHSQGCEQTPSGRVARSYARVVASEGRAER
jgi:hypothetical protein